MTKTTQIGVRMPDDLLHLLDEVAEREERSRTGQVLYIIKDWFMDRAPKRTASEHIPASEWPDVPTEPRDCNKALEQEKV